MPDEVTLTRLKTQFTQLSKERQAEILGMAKALTYAQQSAGFDFSTFMREIGLEDKAEKQP
jgi:hypothetical protein